MGEEELASPRNELPYCLYKVVIPETTYTQTTNVDSCRLYLYISAYIYTCVHNNKEKVSI